MSSSREVKLLLAVMNREEIERKIKALEAEHKSLNAELYSTRVVYPVKGSRTADQGKRHHHENSSKGANASLLRLKRRHNHTEDIHPTKIRLSTNRNAVSKHPMKQIRVFPNNSAQQESPISSYSNQTESKRRSLSRESKGKTRSPTNSASPVPLLLQDIIQVKAAKVMSSKGSKIVHLLPAALAAVNIHGFPHSMNKEQIKFNLKMKAKLIWANSGMVWRTFL